MDSPIIKKQKIIVICGVKNSGKTTLLTKIVAELTKRQENEAAEILYQLCKNEHMRPSEVKEGKIELIAECDGLLKIDKKN